MTWSARRRAWEAKRLGPALDRAPERRTRFSTISDTDGRPALRPMVVGTRRRRPERQRQRQSARRRRPDRGRPSRRAPPPGARPLGRLRPAPRRRAARASRRSPAASTRPGYRSRLWTMRMFAGFGAAEDTNARFQPLLGGRPDRPVDRLRHADALRLRHRRPRGRGRVRDVRRRASAASPTWRSCSTACRSTASRRR